MIKVNWKKIKPFESAAFAIPVIIVLLLLFAGSVAVAFLNPSLLMPLKALTAVCIFITVAFKVHIESRMLQIYMLCSACLMLQCIRRRLCRFRPA